MYEFHRNFGAMTTAREFWGGNNGFLTVAVQFDGAECPMPAGTDYEAAKAAHEAGTATAAQVLLMANAERNLFRVAQACGQRAVIVAVSGVELITETAGLANIDAIVESGSLAYGKVGASSVAPSATNPIYAVTFIIERADVLTKQDAKPGATYAVSVDPADELVNILFQGGAADSSAVNAASIFGTTDLDINPIGSAIAGGFEKPTAVVVKVYDALPVLK